MSLKDDFVIVFRNVSHRQLRSWLTVLGVVIGIAAIVALVSVSRSLESSVEQQFEEFGSDKINVFAASSGGGPPGFGAALNLDDLRAVERITDYELVIGLLARSARVEFRDVAQNALITGIEAGKSAQVFEEFNLGFRDGRPFGSDSNKIVVGPRVADEFFDRALFIGNKLEIEDEKFEIVGITESLGNPQDDSNIYMSLGVMRDLFDDRNGVSFIFAKVKSGTDIDRVAEKTTAELEKLRSGESFEVVTPEQLLDQLGAVLAILQGVLVGIASISLIVGSIGIASSMYTSVLERIREIGIMKAIGATNGEIITIFLIEAALLGAVGGVIGIIVGLGIGYLIGFAAAQAGYSILKISIDFQLMAFALGFATFVGAVSGYFPARSAAKLKPVDALRK